MICGPDSAMLPTASWFETRGVAALLTMRVQDLILRRREAPSRRMQPLREVGSDAARLERDRSRLRLHRVPVLRCALWRTPVADAARPCERADLSIVAGDLLHLLDVLR